MRMNKNGLTNLSKAYIITLLRTNKFACVWLAQLDRALGYGPRGREFESSAAR